MFPALLGIDRALGLGTRLQALQPDLLARIHAVTVVTLIHAADDALDLADQLAVAVTCTQLKRILGLAARALRLVAHVPDLVAQVLDGLPRLLHQFLPRSEEHTSELQSRGHLVCRLLL